MINQTKLNNDLLIITNSDENAKTVTISFMVKCGSYNEDDSNRGIAHFTEHMLFKGTTNMTSEQISQAIEGIGGILNAQTAFQNTKYYCTVPSDFWKDGIRVLSDMIWFNTIPEDEFDREKQVVLEELKMYEDDPSSKVMDLLFKYLHKNHINRQLVGGTIESVTNIKREQMIDFIDKFYVPNNIVVVATGKINHDELVNLVGQYCSQIELNNHISSESKDTFIHDDATGDYAETKDNINQSHLCYGMFGPKPSDDDFPVEEIITTVLGGNSSSRLWQIIREQKGLAYEVSLDSEVLSDTSIMVGYIGLDKANIEDVKNVIKNELLKIKNENITENELERAKRYIKGTSLISLEKTYTQNYYINEAVINGINLDIEEAFKKIDSITVEDVKTFANKYFNENNLTFVQITPPTK